MIVSLTRTVVGGFSGLALVVACSSGIELVDGDATTGGSGGASGSGGTSGSGGGGSDGPDASVGGSRGEILPQLPPTAGSGGDGSIGNVSDGGLSTPCVDDDGDGVCNADDGCPALADQDDSADADGDGVPDACDTCAGPRLTLLGKNPLYYFPFDEAPGATEAQNLGSAGLNAQYVGPVTFGLGSVTDPRGSAVRIPGSSAAFPRISALNVPVFPSTALTAMFWIRTNQTSQYAGISYAVDGVPNAFSVFFDDDLMRLDLEDLTFEQDLDVSTRISDGTWHFVAVTWADELAQFYFDGEPVGALLQTVFANAATRFPTPDPGEAIDIAPGGVLIVGQDQDSLNGGFATTQALDGGVDELAIFDRALPAAEIAEIFAVTTCGERCDGRDNDSDGTVDEGFQGSAPACAAPSCQAIQASGSDFGTGTYFLQADPNAPVTCVFQ